jgi:hypothetical protein
LHNDAVAPDFVQAELDRCGSFRRCGVRGFDLPKNFTLAAKQDDAPRLMRLEAWRECL